MQKTSTVGTIPRPAAGSSALMTEAMYTSTAKSTTSASTTVCCLKTKSSGCTIGGTVKLNTSRSQQLSPKGLVGWWTFDGKDMSGVQAYDSSGNGNRGILRPTAYPRHSENRAGAPVLYGVKLPVYMSTPGSPTALKLTVL